MGEKYIYKCRVCSSEGESLTKVPRWLMPVCHGEMVEFHNGKQTSTKEEMNKGTVWSDRLLFSDFAKHTELKEKLCPETRGQSWDNVKRENAQSFLQTFLNQPNLQLVNIIKESNMSTGFPVWQFNYKIKE